MRAACSRICRQFRLPAASSRAPAAAAATIMPDSNKVKVNYFCLGAVFIFSGSVLLCALGFTVVLPFEATRSWPEVKCEVVSSTYDRNVCSCDDHPNVFDTCISKYPCLLIRVSYSHHSHTPLLQIPPLPSPKNISGPETSSVISVFSGTAETSRKNRNGREVGSENESSEQVGTWDDRSVEEEVNADSVGDDSRETLLPSTVVSLHHGGRYPGKTETTETSGVFVSPLSSTLRTASQPVDSGGGVGGSRHVGLGGRTEGEGGNGSAEPPTTPPHEGGRGESLAKLYRSWDDSFYSECSLTECGDETWNVNQSRRFRADYGRVGQTFACYYDPQRPDMVIIERTTPTAAIHAVVWPSLCLGLGILLWLGLCVGCWSIKGDGASKEDYGPLYS